MDNCPKCVTSLKRAKGYFKSPLNSTDVFYVQEMVCDNPKCDNYCGKDLDNPLFVVEHRESKEN